MEPLEDGYLETDFYVKKVTSSSPPVPSGYSINFVGDPYTEGSNDSAVDLSVANAEVSADWELEITSSGGGTPVTANGTVSTGSFTIENLDLSGLSPGTLTASLILTNGNGSGSPSTDTASLSMPVPSGYAIAFNDPQYGADFNDDDVDLTATNCEIGADWDLEITSSGGGTPVTANGTVAGSTVNINGIDLTPLSSGTLTATFTLTNGTGAGAPVTVIAHLFDGPRGNFQASPTTVVAGEDVQFNDLSIFGPTSWLWEKKESAGSWVNFDGTPTVQNPIEVFTEGFYDIRLTVSNTGGSNTRIFPSYITVAPAPPIGTQTFTSVGTYSYTPPATGNYKVQCWSGGQAGQSSSDNVSGGAGGAGGNYAEATLALTINVDIDVIVGVSGNAYGDPSGGNTYVGDGSEVLAAGPGQMESSIGDVVYTGGSGGAGQTDTEFRGGGGGGSGAIDNNGGPGADGSSGGSGGSTSMGGGFGGSGSYSDTGYPGSQPGGGGGGGCGVSGSYPGGNGGAGQVIISPV